MKAEPEIASYTFPHANSPPDTDRLQINGVFLGPHSIKLYMRILCEYAAKITKEPAVAYPKYYPALAWRKWGKLLKSLSQDS
jgi:hypothetical protein